MIGKDSTQVMHVMDRRLRTPDKWCGSACPRATCCQTPHTPEVDPTGVFGRLEYPTPPLGTYASGFPDEHAFETWLLRLEQLTDAERRLREGEHVSGPAAPAYSQRVHQASRQFAGRVLTTTRQARDLLDNPALQIHQGKGMTCVFDPAKAKCRLGSTQSIQRTPDLTDCQPGCQNIARTDRDIAVLRSHLTELQDLVNDPLGPGPRRERERHELARLTAIVESHDRTRPDTP